MIPAPVCAEVDHLLGSRLGRMAGVPILDDVAAGRFTVACLEPDRLLTFGERRFRALRSLKSAQFTLLPADDPAH